MKIILATAIALLSAPAHAAVVLWDNLSDTYERHIPEVTAKMPDNCRIDRVYKDMRHDRVEAIVECHQTLEMACLQMATQGLEQFAHLPDLLPPNWTDPIFTAPTGALQPVAETIPSAAGTLPGQSFTSPDGQRTIAAAASTLSGGGNASSFGPGSSTSGFSGLFDTVAASSTSGTTAPDTPIALPDGSFQMVSGITTLGGRTVIDLRDEQIIAAVPLPASFGLLLAGVFALVRTRRA